MLNVLNKDSTIFCLLVPVCLSYKFVDLIVITNKIIVLFVTAVVIVACVIVFVFVFIFRIVIVPFVCN